MSLKSKFRRILSGLAAGAMVLTMTAALPTFEIEANAASLCTINTNKTYQRIRGFGGMNHPEWQSYNGGGDMTAAQVQTAFGTGSNELGLSVLRIFVSDDSSAWKNAIPTAQRAQKLGATVFATPWNPPASIRHNGDKTNSGGMYVLNDGAEEAYAKHLNSFVKYCDSQGVHLNSISVQNEPDFSSEWTAWTPERAANFIANYGKAVTDGTTTKLMSPESFQYAPFGANWVSNGGKNYYKAILNNQKAFANCDIFGTHFYGTQRDWMDYPDLEKCGKEIWMTEVYVPNSEANSANRYPEALDVAENIHNGLVVGNMSAYVWWYIRRSYSLLDEQGKITKRGYCMGQYSKFVRPGDVRIDATEQTDKNILISAYKHSDTQIEIVAINKNEDDIQQQFSVDGRTITDIDRYRTSTNENWAKTDNLDHDTSTYWANLPAKSVTTFIVTLTSDGKELPSDPGTPVPAEPIKPDANGYYYHDTFENGAGDWEARGASTLTLSGRVPFAGTNAILVQDREKAWQGIQRALDTTTFKAGESYSFSTNVYFDGESAPATQDFLLSMQYTDAAGETKYAHIAEGTAVNGHYLQLANKSFTIPAGASSPVIYIETAEGSDNFYIDEAIVAVNGTAIQGAEPYEIPATEPDTEPDTAPADTAPASEPDTTPASEPEQQPSSQQTTDSVVHGDINGDNTVDIFDLSAAKSGVIGGFADARAEAAADVNDSGKADVIDIVLLTKFIHGQIKSFPVSH